MIDAFKYWQDGQAVEAGRIIFESLPKENHPTWAVNILQAVLKRTGIRHPSIEHVVEIARRPGDWGNAHEAFSLVRKSTLELERLKNRGPQQTLLLNHLFLAELVAKVTYNSTNPPDEFDEDSGWWIASSVKDILDLINDEQFSADIWSILCDDRAKNSA